MASDLSWNQYKILDYNPQLGMEWTNVGDGYSLCLTNIKMYGANKIDSIEWERSVTFQEDKNLIHNVQVHYNSAVTWEEHKKLNYLALVAFSGYRDDGFINSFYADSGWEKFEVGGAYNTQVGIGYSKGLLYHNWEIGDSFYEYFDIDSNREAIQNNGGSTFFWDHMFVFSWRYLGG